jgi:hypothetical protein
VEAWGFIWIMLVLKIPLALLLYTVWWAVKATPEPVETDGGDGGSGDREPPEPKPPRWPRRRGPHGEPVVPPPPRTRTPAFSRDRVEQ